MLCTVRQDGSPQLSPVLAGLDSHGRVLISSRASSAKVTNLTRDERGWLLVISEAFFGPWVQLGGRVHVVDRPEAVPGLVDLYRSLSGEHPDWDLYREAIEVEDRVLLVMEVDVAGPDCDGSTGLQPGAPKA